MAKSVGFKYSSKNRTKRKGVHSKNASKGCKGFKKKSRGQGL
jgi:hypothetical protein|tara:strand:- start:601 stop:726 length:126 start_codon:yes stop_codon:yes gene_type:complete